MNAQPKNKGGRPPVVLNKEQIKEVEELAAYLTIEQIADYFDIDADTFLAIRKRQSEVFRSYKKGRARKIYRYAKTLEEKALGMYEEDSLKCDTTSIIFFLKTQAGWSEKQLVETKDITPKQPPSIINHFSDEPLAMEIKNDK
jgi:hypothetical protein